MLVLVLMLMLMLVLMLVLVLVLMLMGKRSLMLWERDLGKRVLCGHHRCGFGGVRDRLALSLSNGASFTSALDSLVAVLVVSSKVLEQFTVCLWDLIAGVEDVSESGGQILEGLLVEVVLVGLHVAKLGKGLVAVIQSADERFHALVGLQMRADVASLRKATATLIA